MIRILRIVFLLMCLFTPLLVHAQQPVEPWADGLSYGTALVNPTIAAVKAWRSPQRKCRLGQLLISEVVANGVGLTLKHFIVSPRPCMGFGCAMDGMPSDHTANSAVGMFSSRYGFMATIATGGLRMAAHRHTWQQVLAGAGLGIGAEAAGHLLKCGD